jgi:predicted phosphate transport protein (TIGR00153 family)
MLGSGHIGVWLSRQTEKEVISSCEDHLSKIFQVVDKFKQFIEKYVNNDVEGCHHLAIEISNLEREADQIKENIIEKLMRLLFHPMDQDEIIKLVTTADDIAAHLKSATRKLLYTTPQEVPNNIKEGLKSITQLLVEEKDRLKKTIEAFVSKGDVKRMAEETERIEEAIDDFRVDLLAQVLKWGDNYKYISNWLMIKEAIENIESASDEMENATDILRAMAILRKY